MIYIIAHLFDCSFGLPFKHFTHMHGSTRSCFHHSVFLALSPSPSLHFSAFIPVSKWQYISVCSHAVAWSVFNHFSSGFASYFLVQKWKPLAPTHVCRLYAKTIIYTFAKLLLLFFSSTSFHYSKSTKMANSVRRYREMFSTHYLPTDRSSMHKWI